MIRDIVKEITEGYASKKIAQSAGIKLIDTKHSVERAKERYDFDVKDTVIKMWNKAVPKLKKEYNFLDFPVQEKPIPLEVLIFSKSKKLGMIIGFHKDNFLKEPDDKNHGFIITILPKNKQQPKKGTYKLLVESHEEASDVYSPEFMELLNNLETNLEESDQGSGTVSYFGDDFNFEMVLEDNKVYDTGINFIVIEVD